MKYLSWEKQKLMLKTVKETKGKERDYVMLELFCHAGVRVSEFCYIDVGDVRNKSQVWIRREHMKNGRGRFVEFDVKIQDILHKWLAHKMNNLHESIEDNAPLFVTRSGRRFTRTNLTQSVVQKWMKRLGFTTTRNGRTVSLFGSHSLRHTCFKRMRERGASIEAIAKQAGHKNPAYAMIYTEATDQEVREAVHLLAMSPSRAERMSEAL